MEQISRKLVDTTWLQVSQYSLKEIIPDQKRLMDSQPYITQFLVQFTEDYPEEISELALHLTHVVWKVFSLVQGKVINTIDLDDVVLAVRNREEWLEVFQGLEIPVLTNLIHQEKSFSQPNVLDFLLDILIDEQEDNPEVKETEIGYLFWLLLIVIDVFSNKN
jgi:hypothetical protein